MFDESQAGSGDGHVGTVDTDVGGGDGVRVGLALHASLGGGSRFGRGLSGDDLEALVLQLSDVERDVDDHERIRQITALERLKSACAAAQARVTVDLHTSRRRSDAEAGRPVKEQGAGVADEVALARRDSKSRGNRHLGLALALVKEMPHTMGALALGDISEWRATVMVRETAVLSVEHRREVDARLAARLATGGDRSLGHAARALAYELDPTSAKRRCKGAVADRRVSIRPAPDTMSMLTGFLPAVQGAAAYGALRRHAVACRTAGDPRSMGQIMADTLVERVTGQAVASEVPVEVQVIMTDKALFAGDDTAAHVVGFGPVPASTVRDLLNPDRQEAEVRVNPNHAGRGHSGPAAAPGRAGAGRPSARPPGDGPDRADPGPSGRAAPGGSDGPDPGVADRARVWLRRLYADPETGELVGMDSRRRIFDGQLRRFLILRDQVCRTPWCDAPIRHADHVQAVMDGGPTSAANGQGLCEHCNYTKQLPGWNSKAMSRPVVGRSAGARPAAYPVSITTPSGHTYTAPVRPVLPSLGRRPAWASPSTVDIRLAALLTAV